MDSLFIMCYLFFSAKDSCRYCKIERKVFRHVVCLCNFRRFNMFCTIILYSGHKQGKRVKDTGNLFKPCYCVG